MWMLKAVILVGISYIILGPVISMVSSAFFTSNDLYNPVVVLFPVEGTLENFRGAFQTLVYPRTLLTTVLYVASLTLIQVIVCSMAGYGFCQVRISAEKAAVRVCYPDHRASHGYTDASLVYGIP